MKKTIIVKQHDIRDCGACCLQSIIKFYDGYIPLEKIKLDTRTNLNGTTAYNIIKAAKKYGFDAYGTKLKNIKTNQLYPAIAHLILKNGLTHFVVIYKINKENIYIMDPAKGYIKYKIKDFEQIWSNVILILKPYQKMPQYPHNNSIKNLSLFIISKEYKMIFNIFFNSLLIAFISISLSYYFEIITNSIENSYFYTSLYLFIFFLVLTLLKLYISYKKNEYEIYLNKNINLAIIPAFFKHIIKLPLNVIKNRTPGEIITRVSELNNIKDLFSDIFLTIVLELTLTICSMYILFTINNKLFFILCIICIIYILVGLIFNPLIYKKINDNIDYETEFNSNLVEKISSIDTIKNLNLTSQIFNDLENSYISYLENSFAYALFNNKFEIIKNSINDIGLFLLSSFGIYLVLINELTLIKLITFNSLLIYLLNPIKNIINVFPKISLIKLSIIKVNEFLMLETENEGHQEKFVNGKIVFKNINYSYDDYHFLIKNFNLEINQNERIILRGRSGIGKSTLCRFLNRSLDNYQGSISINDINIKDYSIKTIRENIRYVSQKEKLFSKTIAENILLDNKVSKEELNQILKITKVNEIVDTKPLRLNTLLFDSGSNISGGERQRIILARAIIKKPKILILDEALSEINKRTEYTILANLNEYLKNTTIIYITHHQNIPNYRVVNLECYG